MSFKFGESLRIHERSVRDQFAVTRCPSAIRWQSVGSPSAHPALRTSGSPRKKAPLPFSGPAPLEAGSLVAIEVSSLLGAGAGGLRAAAGGEGWRRADAALGRHGSRPGRLRTLACVLGKSLPKRVGSICGGWYGRKIRGGFRLVHELPLSAAFWIFKRKWTLARMLAQWRKYVQR